MRARQESEAPGIRKLSIFSFHLVTFVNIAVEKVSLSVALLVWFVDGGGITGKGFESL